MSYLGKEIHRAHDQYGSIRVFDDGEKRYLTFGTDTEQSCVLKSNAADLQYEYTRAMLLPLLFQPTAKRALILGLGAGSLATCLTLHCRQLKLTAVELRQAVIDTAYQHFQLPRTKKLQVIADNADHFLRHSASAKYHFIFSDLYGAEDVDNIQLQDDYIDLCQQHLHSDGWLVLNCWRNHRSDGDLQDSLSHRFRHVFACNTQAGNWVLLASNMTSLPSRSQLKENAKSWAKSLGFALPLSRMESVQQVD